MNIGPDPYDTDTRPWITYLPSNPEGVPLLNALCNDAAHVAEITPFTVWSTVHASAHVGTLMVCHSKAMVDEAIGLSETRPMVVWAWLLDENYVAAAADVLPVLFGIVLYADVLAVEPSQPMPHVAEEARICAQLERIYSIPSSESLMIPR